MHTHYDTLVCSVCGGPANAILDKGRVNRLTPACDKHGDTIVRAIKEIKIRGEYNHDEKRSE